MNLNDRHLALKGYVFFVSNGKLRWDSALTSFRIELASDRNRFDSSNVLANLGPQMYPWSHDAGNTNENLLHR